MRRPQAAITKQLGLPDENEVRVHSPGRYMLVIEVPKPFYHWKAVNLSRLNVRSKPNIVTLGVNQRDSPVRLNLLSPNNAHIAVYGQTRSGKTTTMKVIGWNILNYPEHASVIMIDTAKQGSSFSRFNNCKGLMLPVIVDNLTLAKTLVWLNEEIKKRGEEKANNPDIEFKPIYVIVDEIKLMFDTSKIFVKLVNNIASLGAEFNIKLVLGTQHSKVSSMGGDSDLKQNMTVTLCGSISKVGSMTALGSLGAETLLGKGDFLKKSMGRIERITIANITNREIESIPKGKPKGLNFDDLDYQSYDLPQSISVKSKFLSNKAKPSNEAIPPKPAEVAHAVFNPSGKSKLKNTLKVGDRRAKEILAYALEFRAWAAHHGESCLPDTDLKVQNALQSKQYNWLDSSWEEL